MKTISQIVLLITVCLSGCNKDVVSTNAHTETSEQRGFEEVTFQQDFLTDYVINGKHRVQGRPSETEWKIYDMIGPSDPKVLSDRFDEVNSLLKNIVDNSAAHSVDHVIQRVYLKYLREVYLIDSTTSGKSRVVDILRELMPTNPVDLDVVADAYFKIEDLLTEEERSLYYQQIVNIYNSDRAYIPVQAERIKSIYNTIEDANERAFALMSAKQLERRSKSLSYVDKKYGLSGGAGRS